jgi:hypothetical protein
MEKLSYIIMQVLVSTSIISLAVVNQFSILVYPDIHSEYGFAINCFMHSKIHIHTVHHLDAVFGDKIGPRSLI